MTILGTVVRLSNTGKPFLRHLTALSQHMLLTHHTGMDRHLRMLRDLLLS